MGSECYLVTLSDRLLRNRIYLRIFQKEFAFKNQLISFTYLVSYLALNILRLTHRTELKCTINILKIIIITLLAQICFKSNVISSLKQTAWFSTPSRSLPVLLKRMSDSGLNTVNISANIAVFMVFITYKENIKSRILRGHLGDFLTGYFSEIDDHVFNVAAVLSDPSGRVMNPSIKEKNKLIPRLVLNCMDNRRLGAIILLLFTNSTVICFLFIYPPLVKHGGAGSTSGWRRCRSKRHKRHWSSWRSRPLDRLLVPQGESQLQPRHPGEGEEEGCERPAPQWGRTISRTFTTTIHFKIQFYEHSFHFLNCFNYSFLSFSHPFKFYRSRVRNKAFFTTNTNVCCEIICLVEKKTRLVLDPWFGIEASAFTPMKRQN